MFDPLLGMDLKGRIQPALAESWEISNDGKLYTFRLRRGVRFHNGQEMIAEDVKFSMDFVMNPKNGASGFVDLNIVEKVEAPEKYLVRVSTKKVSPAFLSSLTALRSFPVVPRGSLKEGIDKIGAFPPGTGPFKFVEWKPQQQIVLERHEQFWGHAAPIDRLILRPIRDDSVRFTALRTGELDLIERTPLEWVKEVVAGKIKGVQYTTAIHSEFRGIEFNVAQAPFNNKKLRQAVACAIDKKEILQAGYLGFGETTDQKFPKGHQWYVDGLPPANQDLQKARALLKEAGYQGETIDFLVEPVLTRQAEATMLQAQLRKIGMSIKLDTLESGAYRARQRKGEFAFKFDSGGLYPDPIQSYGEAKCEPDPQKRATNTTAYCDKEMDRLLERLETEIQPAKREAILREIVKKLHEDLPEIYLGFVPQFYAFRDHVKNFTTDSDANFRWWGGGLNHAWLDK
jgi:peptide/nickel transport system substrate-binding protein